jgi:prevent-host-death family protein
MAITIGIRELRQHASRYLRRVRDGETITVTDRGEPIAEIRPVKQPQTILDRLIAEGRATPPEGDLAEYLKQHPPARARPGEPTLTEVLLQMRDEERS